MDEGLTDWADGPIPEGKLEGYVWWCEDDCNCEEAVIVLRRHLGPAHYESTTLWRGSYHIEGEPGASTELNREAKRLRKHHNVLYHRIEWPWDRSQRRQTEGE